MPIQFGTLTLFTLKEVAEKLGVHYHTVRSYVIKGRIDAQRIGGAAYISEDSLKEFFNQPYRRKFTDEQIAKTFLAMQEGKRKKAEEKSLASGEPVKFTVKRYPKGTKK